LDSKKITNTIQTKQKSETAIKQKNDKKEKGSRKKPTTH
jgi:hypothetical protein